MSNVKIKLYSFEAPEQLMTKFDKAIQNDYGNRSAAIRDLMRQFIRKKKGAE